MPSPAPLTAPEFHALVLPDTIRPDRIVAVVELTHRLDFHGRGACPCGCVAAQHYDAEYIVPENDADDAPLGTALQYSCRACQGSYTLSFVRRPGLTDADLLRVVDRRFGGAK